MTQQNASLVDKCLIATPAIKDPIFASSLVYMCEHSEHGSMGLVVNHKTSQTLEDIFTQLDIDCLDESIKQQPVYIGGPVQLEQGFVLHTSTDTWQKTFEVSPGIHLTSSMDVLQAIANNKGSRRLSCNTGLFRLGIRPTGIGTAAKFLAHLGLRCGAIVP